MSLGFGTFKLLRTQFCVKSCQNYCLKETRKLRGIRCSHYAQSFPLTKILLFWKCPFPPAQLKAIFSFKPPCMLPPYLTARASKKQEEPGSTGSLPKCSQQLLAEWMSFNLGCSHGHRHKYVSHHQCLQGTVLAGSWSQESSHTSIPGSVTWAASFPTDILTTSQNAHTFPFEKWKYPLKCLTTYPLFLS